MNTTEKVNMLQGAHGQAGQHNWATGNNNGCPRLRIPQLHLEDGPNGVADNVGEVTTFPSSLTVAASWDRELLHRYGAAVGREQRGKGMNVMLGPGVNLARVPQGGRNFEYLGEDPVLTSELSESEVNGLQAEGVLGCAKHFIDNNQEGPGHNGRVSQSATVGQRAQRELYYKALSGAIKAGVGWAIALSTLCPNCASAFPFSVYLPIL